MSDLGPVRYDQPTTNALCCVEGCQSRAEYEVYLYDQYRSLEGPFEFFEQDYTCPFLCKSHLKQNEAEAKGERRPRGFVVYPFTNRNGAQGYTKYAPLQTVCEALVNPEQLPLSPSVVLAYEEVNAELLQYLQDHPEELRNLDPRTFEKLIANIFSKRGFETSLTPRTRDGGKDVYAVKRDDIGSSLYVIECKRYAEQRKVGVDVVRGLYGVATAENATQGIIATTSSFTGDAIAFASPLEYKLSLRDFDALKTWLNKMF